MEEVSKGDHVVQTKPLIPLALPQTGESQAAASMDRQQPRDLGCSQPAFAASVKTLLQLSRWSGASFEEDWQQRSGRNLVPASQAGLFPLLCPEHIPLLMGISLPVPGDQGGTDRQWRDRRDGEAVPVPTALAELPSRLGTGKGWDKHLWRGRSCPGSQ